MKITRQLTSILAAMFASLVITTSFADSPKSVDMPDRHSVEVQGKVNLYRVQIEGMKLGEGVDQADAELFVTLDSDPKMVYALELKKNSPEANRVMAETLRAAYINKLPVTLYHQIAIKKNNNHKILMVQFN